MLWWECVHGGEGGRRSAGRAAAAGIGGPGKRWGHTCNAVRGGKLLYVFGGYGSDNSQTNDVHVFDTVKKTWNKPLIKGTPPSPRDSHSCTTVGNRLFLFGGTDGTNPLKDLHILDTSTNTWIVPAVSGKGPDAREGHSAALVDKRLFIFGGCGKSADTHQEVYFNDLYILDTENLIWERAKTSGTPPSPRDSHTCSSWKNKIIVLGGEDPSDCYLSDVYMLDAGTLVWRQVNTSGQMLAPRAGHTTVALGSNLFVFGGFTDARNLYDDLNVLNVDSSTWRKVTAVNQGPSARFSVAGDCLDERRGIIVLIGGCNKNLEALDDMYYLHANMPGENGVAEPQPEKPSPNRMLIKHRENHPPANELQKNNDMHMIGLKSDPSFPLHLRANCQAGASLDDSRSTGEVKFEAIITQTSDHGYTIETIINGQFLRGFVPFFTACPIQNDHNYSKRRRMRKDSGGSRVNEHQALLNNVQTFCETKSSDQEQVLPVYAKESTSPMQVPAERLTSSTTNAGLCPPYMTSENVGPSSLSSRDLKYGTPSVEMARVPPEHMRIDAGNLNLPPKQALQTEIPALSSERFGDHRIINSAILGPLPMPSDGLKNVPVNLERQLIPADILKSDVTASEPQKFGAEAQCEGVDRKHYPHFQVQGAEQPFHDGSRRD